MNDATIILSIILVTILLFILGYKIGRRRVV